MEELIEKLDETIRRVYEISKYLIEDKWVQANEKIISLIPLVQQLFQLMEKSVASCFEDPEIGLNAMLNCLQRALGAMEQKDTILLADIFHYDFASKLESNRIALGGIYESNI